MPTFLIAAAHGYGNVGDDICAHSGKYLIKRVASRNKTIVTSPPYKARLVRKSDAVVLSGGGIIYDRVKENVNNYLIYLETAQKAGKLTAAIGLGVQGVVTDWGRDRYREVLNNTQLVTARTEEDRKTLEEIGVNDVVATQDLGFLADEWIPKPLFKPRIKPSAKPRLGLVLMDVKILQAYKKGENKKLIKYIEIVENNLENLAKEFDIWLFSHSEDDKEWRNEIAQKHKLKIVKYSSIKDLPKFFHLYKQMDLILGVRFHSVILGLLANKPVVGVGSEAAKLFRLARESPSLKKQCYSMDEPERLEYLFANLPAMHKKGKFRVIPKKELEMLKNKARKNEKLLRLVQNHSRT